jgi:hypothetical protein
MIAHAIALLRRPLFEPRKTFRRVLGETAHAHRLVGGAGACPPSSDDGLAQERKTPAMSPSRASSKVSDEL